jgi:xanthine dehydrogenase accessory factor
MRWFEHLARLTEQKVPLVIVTLVSVRGHAPREAGAKMLVTADAVYETIGGGNLEATAVALAREMLAAVEAGLRPAPTTHTIRLTEKAPAEYGLQCCGGEVTILLEPLLSAKPSVAIFGVGHVGLALAKVLSILPVELWLVDSRTEMLEGSRLASLHAQQAEVRVYPAPIPETVTQDLPPGTHVLVVTHDHAEDLAVLDAALRRCDLGFIGLIGSSGKWRNFQQKLRQQGFSSEQIAHITCPIGLPQVPGKSPEAIAIATAAQLVPLLLPTTQTRAESV